MNPTKEQQFQISLDQLSEMLHDRCAPEDRFVLLYHRKIAEGQIITATTSNLQKEAAVGAMVIALQRDGQMSMDTISKVFASLHKRNMNFFDRLKFLLAIL